MDLPPVTGQTGETDQHLLPKHRVDASRAQRGRLPGIFPLLRVLDANTT